jgi:hypothetical protein
MPHKGKVHDDGGDQLHGFGIGTIRVVRIHPGIKPRRVTLLPFVNSGGHAEKAAVTFKVKEILVPELDNKNIRIAWDVKPASATDQNVLDPIYGLPNNAQGYPSDKKATRQNWDDHDEL